MVRFRPGASSSEIKSLEIALDVRLSEELQGLLRETNGVSAEDGSWYVWPTQQIIAENVAIRQQASDTANDGIGYMPFDNMLFFANAGVDGILFALPIPAGQTQTGWRVFAWYPIEDSRPCIAASLEDYLRRWLTGVLRI
jgi:hypothetical protein